ncbi:adenosine kinase [Vallitalea longa]|uniref:Adenosine kinase n=1 Tax=Vallitalea longa TaxID=2936439 RepID=A0A9W5YD77_9FIRM|nr:PfkB family carbohydrate kinase [Vallitalea longa]GKX30218.1 adenosine kinase [Vallitalea longa]
MTKDIDIIAVGYPSLDRIIKTEDSISIGKTSIIQNSDNSKIYYGGCNVNIAYTCAKLSLKSMLMMRVGNDFQSTGYRDFLQDIHICLDGIEVIEEDVTSNSYLIENDMGNHITLFYPGAMSDKYPVHIDEEIIKRAKYGVITVGNLEYNIAFAKACINENVPIIFGMKCDFKAFKEDALKYLLSSSTIIFMNEGEKKEIKKLFNLKDICDLFDNGRCKCLVITQGKNGSLILCKHNGKIMKETVPIAKPDKVTDTSGVGDSYIAGFIYGLVHKMSYMDCGKVGATVASFIIEEMGCLGNVPSEEQLKERYKLNFINNL